MTAAQVDRVMALSEWKAIWEEGRTGWHQPHVNQMLENNLDKVLCRRQQVRFFFPLCGKAVDMKWLADMGHVVVGVDISEKAIKQFFEEQSLEYKEEPVPAIPEARVFKSSDSRISLYQCDLYKFSSAIEGQFGGIWDRGSLVAINPCDRQKYSTLIMSLMDKDCRYLLDTFEYNPELFAGPPFFVPEEAVKSLYGDSRSIAYGAMMPEFHSKAPWDLRQFSKPTKNIEVMLVTSCWCRIEMPLRQGIKDGDYSHF